MLLSASEGLKRNRKKPVGTLGDKPPPRAGQLALLLNASTSPGCGFILHTNNEYYSPVSTGDLFQVFTLFSIMCLFVSVPTRPGAP